MQVDDQTIMAMHEDIGYIRAKIDTLPALDERVRALEKRWWQFPVTGLIALIATLGRIHF